MLEAFIVDAVRTPLVARRLAEHHPPGDLGAHSIKALIERTGIDPNAVDDVVFGNVDSVAAGRCVARTAGSWPECRARAGHHRSPVRLGQQAIHFAAQA